MIRLIGNDPVVIGELKVEGWDEFCFVQDMPVKLPRQMPMVPLTLAFAIPFVKYAFEHLAETRGTKWLSERYLYLCAKHTMVPANCPQTRPGWHTDGYNTDDLSFLWCDAIPTEFLKQAMRTHPNDDHAMMQMAQEAQDRNVCRGDVNTIYIMNDGVIHRPGCSTYVQPRRFLKLSVSRYPYDLAGNARNPLLDTPWSPTRQRDLNRNKPENRS